MAELAVTGSSGGTSRASIGGPAPSDSPPARHAAERSGWCRSLAAIRVDPFIPATALPWGDTDGADRTPALTTAAPSPTTTFAAQPKPRPAMVPPVAIAPAPPVAPQAAA